MARAPSKRTSASASEDETPDRLAADVGLLGDSPARYVADGQMQIKRVKRERLQQFHGSSSKQRNKEHDGGLDDESAHSEEDLDEDDHDDGEDEQAITKRFDFPDDEVNMAAYERARSTRGIVIGSASEAGILKSVSLVDFMCHRHLTTDFGPRMNFLVGHNGSGKSAVLTGITVALGGKAALTGRGQGLKDLIRRGSDKSVITLILVNTGSNAYRPEAYPATIIIERHLEKSGGSSYKFRATKDGKIIANKREELTRILEHFNIAIDSPLTVLTQDQSRSFLQQATDETLYKFFLDGTQLTALASTYENINTNVKELRSIETRVEEAIPDAQTEVETLGRKLKASRKVIELKATLKVGLRELAWAYVNEKEKEIQVQQTKLEEHGERLRQAISKLEETTQQHKPLEGEIHLLENELKAFDESRQPIQVKQQKLKRQQDSARTEARSIEDSIKEVETSIQEHGKQAHKSEKSIKELRAKLDADADPEQLRIREEIHRNEELYRKSNEDLPRHEAEAEARHRASTDAINAETAIRDDIQAISNEGAGVQKQLDNLKSQSSSRLAAFGQNIQLVTDAIKMTQWDSAPIGPLGLHVQLKDPRYKDVFHSICGAFLCTFAVQSDRDRQKLSAILRTALSRGYRPGTGGQQPPPIVTYSNDLFDYSRGDLSGMGETILSKLNFDNEYVKRIFINAMNIESTFVAVTDDEANKGIDQMRAQGIDRCVFYTAQASRHQGRPDGGRGSGPVERWRGNSLLSGNVNEEMRNFQTQSVDLQSRRDQARQRLFEATDVVKQARQSMINANNSVTSTKHAISNAEKTVERLRDKLAEEPADEVGAHEQSRKESLDNIAVEKQQLQALEEDKVKVGEILERCREELANLDVQLEQFVPERERKNSALTVLVGKRDKIHLDIKHYSASLRRYEDQKSSLEDGMAALVTTLEDWTNKARGYWTDRVPVNHSSVELNAQQEQLRRAIQDAENRQGYTAEEVAPALEAAEAKVGLLQKDLKDLRKMRQVANDEYKSRKLWWTEMRGHLGVQARCSFTVYMSQRDLNGRLDFDHTNDKLAIIVRTPGQTQAQSTQHGVERNSKTIKTLSGGERSFATVSLLLSLWETMSGPIRCLDEWDVFLDNINRGVAAKMLIDGARETDEKQFILISPQAVDSTNLEANPDNRMIRMSDPDRNQSTLILQPA